MFIYILLFMLLLMVGANVYIYVRLFQAVPPVGTGVRIAVAAGLVLLSLTFIASMMLRHVELPAWLSQGLFRFGAVWLLFLLYMIPALVLTDVAGHFFPAFRQGFWVAVLLDAAVLFYGNWNYRHPRVETVRLTLPNTGAGVPRRIVAVSDVHLGEGTGQKQLARYVDLINAQRPDVILIAGDLIDNSVRPLWRDGMAEELNRLQAPMGIYMAPGNHEYISGMEAVEAFLKQTPITLLHDSLVRLPGNLTLIGRDDRMNRRRAGLSSLMKAVPDGSSVIVLDHQPYNVQRADSLGVDLLFCGHTHRGQVWPITWVTDAIFEQSHGYRKWPRSHVYVSQGLSLWGPPFRIGSFGEIVVFELE